MIITDLEHISLVCEADAIEGGAKFPLELLLALINQVTPFSYSKGSISALALGARASISNVTGEFLSTAVGGQQVASATITVEQLALG